MAVYRTGTSIHFTQTASTFTSGAISLCGFFKFDNFTNNQGIYEWRDVPGGVASQVSLNANATGLAILRVRVGSTNYDTGTVTLSSTGVWYFIGGTRSSAGTSSVVYARLVNATGALSSATGTPAATSITFSQEGTPNQGVSVGVACAGLRTWTDELTAEQLERESRQIAPNRLLNLKTWHPCIGGTLAENYRDFGVNNAPFTTALGSPSVVEGPPVPWRVNQRRRRVPYVVAGGRTVLNTRSNPLGVNVGMGWRMPW